MDRTEKLEYEKGIEQYFDDHKVYDLFEKLFKELIINKPENPIDYLIERLKRKEVKRIFITGYSGTNRKSISLSIANALGYSCLSMDHLIEREISKKWKIQQR
jgi:adenylate kinase